MERAISVFSGRVEDIKWNGGDFDHVAFSVTKRWKGQDRQKATVLTEHPSITERLLDVNTGCGFVFKENQEYLVYTYASKASPEKVSRCGRSRKLSGAEEDIETLNRIINRESRPQ